MDISVNGTDIFFLDEETKVGDKDHSIERLINGLPGKEIYNAIGHGISIADTDLKILFQNKAHKDMFGGHTGEYCYRAYAKKEEPCEACPLTQVFKDGGVHTAETIFYPGTGRSYFDVTASSLITKSGKVLAGIELFRDITRRRQIEAQLRESEERFRTIFESSMAGIFFADANGRLLQTNPAFLNMLGYTQDELTGGFAQIAHPDDLQDSLRLFHDAVDGKLNNFKIEKRYIKKDGGIMWGHMAVTAIKDPKGKFKYIMVMIEDVSGRKKLEDKLQAVAVTDELTGLFNRRGFFTLAEHQFKAAERFNNKMSLLYLDLDNLKAINDELGHKTGDEALWDVAGIIKKSFRKSDIIARIGGDEFAVLLTELVSPGTEEAVIKHLHDNLDDHNKHTGRSYNLSLSIGIAQFDPDNPCTLDWLLTQADILMYKDKKRHKRRDQAVP